MPSTPLNGLRYPAQDGSDLDDVPLWLFRLASDTESALANVSGATTGTLAARPSATKANALYVVNGDAALANNGRMFLSVQTAAGPPAVFGWTELGLKLVTGTLAARPTTFVGNRIYVVTGDSTAANNGLTFLDTGTAWVPVGGGGSTVRAVATAVGDVPVTSKGFSSGQTADLYQAQASDGTPLYRVTSRGRLVLPVDASVAYAYDGSGRLSTVTVKDAGGATVLTSTLGYSGSNTFPSSQTDVGEGRTDTYSMTWNTDGTLATRTAVRS